MAFAAPPPLPPTPAPIKALIYARPFVLNEGFRYYWRQEKPMVSEGYLLVIEVDPDLVYPRQTAEPVLFVGDQTAMRLNVGYNSGRVIALVPDSAARRSIRFGRPQLPETPTAETIRNNQATVNTGGNRPLSVGGRNTAPEQGGNESMDDDFNSLPVAEILRRIWFGTPQLPEAVTAETIKKEQALANAEDVHPLSVQEVNTAHERGGDLLEVNDFNELLKEAALLIKQYAGDEGDLADILASQGN